jgi:uncharacterized tellurite resistance protein B-like protein
MSKSNAIKALAKVMIAAAWADGSISHEEINCLKDLLFQLPEMTASDWAELDIYIDSPVSPAERDRLVAEMQQALSSDKDRQLALLMIDELVHADGDVPASEQAVAEAIKAAIRETNVGALGQMGKLMRASIHRRSQALKDAPNRELFLEDFQNNRIYYNLSRRPEFSGINSGLDEQALRMLSLAGGLMARVADVDRDVQQAELDCMARAMRNHWELSAAQSLLAAQIAASEISKGWDNYRLAREFFINTTEPQRVRFLDVLFAVADGDGRVSYDETEEIRDIATALKLTHRQFIDAKLKIPRERRAQ